MGLNPLPHLIKKILQVNYYFFFALVFIMMSVSSLFFDTEKGIGITTTAKKDKGYARWATTKEMKKALKEFILQFLF
jgi:hypothetical protein